jgi:hypothetical protein
LPLDGCQVAVPRENCFQISGGDAGIGPAPFLCVHTYRIPGFAICARCGGKISLGPCHRCGLLVCRECRGGGECMLCCREELLARIRVDRHRRMRRLGHQVGVAACIAATALAGLGAALLPDPPLPVSSEGHGEAVARAEVRFVADAVERYFDSHGATCPPSLGELRREGYLAAPPVDPWGEPLLYGCMEAPRSFVVLSKGPDRLAGTADDVDVAVP